jgi:hypothetical protein
MRHRLLALVMMSGLSVAIPRTLLAGTVPIQPAEVTASSSYSAAYAPGKAADNDPSTFWLANGGPTQWIMYDLGRAVTLQKIRLVSVMSPNSPASSQIELGTTPSNLAVKATANATSTNQMIEVDLGGVSARYVRVTTTSGQSWVAWASVQIFEVQYLGYWASAFDNHGTGDYTKVTHTEWGAGLTWIRTEPGSTAPPYSTATLVGKLAAAKEVGSKVIVVADLWLWQRSGCSGGATLCPALDWKDRWKSVADAVNNGYSDTVLGFCPLDEPYKQAADNKISAESMRGYMKSMAEAIRTSFPTKVVAVIHDMLTLEQVAVGNLGSQYNAMFDWVGFDCYGWDSCISDPTRSVPWGIQKLKAWLSPGQRLIAVPTAYTESEIVDDSVQVDLIRQIDLWNLELLSDNRYVLVAPFLWPSMNLDGDASIEKGAEALPHLARRMKQLAFNFTSVGGTGSGVRVYPVHTEATRTYSTSYSPWMVNDDDIATSWNAGAMAPQGIFFDMGELTTISRVKLTMATGGGGASNHVLYGWANDHYEVITTFGSSSTASGQPFDLQIGPRTYRYFSVSTVQSPSWVAWSEIKFLR